MDLIIIRKGTLRFTLAGCLVACKDSVKFTTQQRIVNSLLQSKEKAV